MIHFVLLVCLATATATNSTNNATVNDTSTNSTKEILKASETADPGKVEIVKQIRRLNEDGSYTIGYEADDGTFKIESRDVLGNVKGTFGYIDQDGEIKRVTYSSSGDTTPIPVTSTTPSIPTIVRMNKTISSTTRRPLATVVYPTRSSIRESATRGTVIQSIPRRRPVSTSARAAANLETTTENQNAEETTSNILNLYKSREETKTRTQILKPVSATLKEDLISKQSTTNLPTTVKPVHEDINEDEYEASKTNTIHRELFAKSPNPHMMSLQQSAGDDSTDVYGGHQSLGTVRPLFTTTTSRPRLIPIHTLVEARQNIQRHYQEPAEEQEATVEASTGRVYEPQNIVTSNPVPVVHIQEHRDSDNRLYQQPIYRRPQSTVRFRTDEYLRDNPGAPVPIGNQRPFLHYEYQDKVLDQQFLSRKETPIAQQTKSAAEPATVPYDIRPATRIISIPVDERGVPVQGYQARFVNPYRPTPTPVEYQPRYDPLEEMNAISTPVSTRDLKRLLQILILRQNRLQALMDQLVAPGPPYQPLPMYRQDNDYNQHQISRHYVDDDRYDYRYDQQYRQDAYSNQMSYENPQYESQRYVPRRRLYTRHYDTAGSSSNNVEDAPEYLPADIREALLLKMLMLAINPDFMPTPAPSTELTTAAPQRKQVRNVQILGEEGSEVKSMQRH
ncbi:unnamed protein product [Parnassius apollo]|uniref:(apollo) hypothetical protein n=1 Tax=Parnassius apollo TaxID=110799 RepID=A0A8S3X3Q9_PARAO|nr:unnamed protein product [Parnassius apollo]